MNNKLGVLMLVAVSLVLVSPQSARTQAYPTKQIEIICPWAAGTSDDIMSRLIANIGPKYLGQSMFVTNKTGAVSSLAAGDVIASKPDGYKLMESPINYWVGTINMQKLPFDPYDVVPLANFMSAGQGVVVKADSPYRTFKDLLSFARKHPGDLKWSNPGRGTTIHIMLKLIFQKEGVNTIDVPFKGGTAEGIIALLGGNVDASVVTYPSVSEQLKAGKARFLMVFSSERLKDYPNVPCAAELGYPDAVIPMYSGLFVHKNTPEPIKKILQNFCKKIYDDPEFKKGLARAEADPLWGDADFVKASIKKSQGIAIPILKELGLYVGK